MEGLINRQIAISRVIARRRRRRDEKIARQVRGPFFFLSIPAHHGFLAVLVQC